MNKEYKSNTGAMFTVKFKDKVVNKLIAVDILAISGNRDVIKPKVRFKKQLEVIEFLQEQITEDSYVNVTSVG